MIRPQFRSSMFSCWALLCGLAVLSSCPCQSVASDEPEARENRISDQPSAETRIYWAWPEFLSGKSVLLHSDASESKPLSQDESPRAKWFNSLDWLSGRPVEPSFEFSPEEFVIRADNGWTGASEPTIKLVRGGMPRLFGANGRLRGEYGDEFDDVKRIRGQLLLALIGNHIGIDTSGNYWEDNRPRPEALGDFWTGDLNLVYSMDAQRVAMRGGAGASWVYDEELDVGYNTTYGADLFLTRPWLISGEIDYGKINSEKLFHWRATFGVQLLRAEIYLGYDSYKWNHIRFDGPVAGAGLWF